MSKATCMPATPLDLPTADDMREAALPLAGVAHRTPVARSSTLDRRLGAQVFFKCENLQRMGAFKFRGAYNTLVRLAEPVRRAGVITYSSGNHAQATALSAQLLGIPATILMPTDTPRVKLEATRGYGARVVLYDRFRDDREAICAALIAEHAYCLVPPFDHTDVIAGQGTAALELLEDVGELDLLLTTLGGGGLLAGSALAAQALAPSCHVVGVEPDASNDGLLSLRAGHIVRIPPPKALPEGALGTHVGERNFAIMQRYVHDVLTVGDESVLRAMRFLAERMKLVVEPTGALPLAALLDERLPVAGLRIGVVLSGGNVNLSRYAGMLAGGCEQAG